MGDGLTQLDFVRNRVDREQEIALLDDIAVLEADLGERATNLGTQLHPFHRRELTEESEPPLDVAWSGALTATVGRAGGGDVSARAVNDSNGRRTATPAATTRASPTTRVTKILPRALSRPGAGRVQPRVGYWS